MRQTHQPSFVSGINADTKEGWCVRHTNPLLCLVQRLAQKRAGVSDAPTIFCAWSKGCHKRGLARQTHQPFFVCETKADTQKGWCVRRTNPLLRLAQRLTQKRVGVSDTPTLVCVWSKGWHKRGLVCQTHQPSFASGPKADTKKGWCVRRTNPLLCLA